MHGVGWGVALLHRWSGRAALSRSLSLFFFFSFIFISWRLIILQYCSGFCHTFTCIPHLNRPHLPLHSIPLGLPSAPGPSTCRAALLKDLKRTSHVDSERAAFQIEQRASTDTKGPKQDPSRTCPGTAEATVRRGSGKGDRQAEEEANSEWAGAHLEGPLAFTMRCEVTGGGQGQVLSTRRIPLLLEWAWRWASSLQPSSGRRRGDGTWLMTEVVVRYRLEGQDSSCPEALPVCLCSGGLSSDFLKAKYHRPEWNTASGIHWN